jgi:hypothetical protein
MRRASHAGARDDPKGQAAGKRWDSFHPTPQMLFDKSPSARADTVELHSQDRTRAPANSAAPGRYPIMSLKMRN